MPVFAAGRHNAVNLTLSNHRIAVAAKTGIKKKLGDIAQTHGRLIELIFALAGSVVTTGNRHLVAVESKPSVSVVDGERNLGKALRLSVRCAVKNQPFHAGAAKRPGGLFPQDPANRVRDIAFSASVRTDDSRHTIVKGQRRPVRKGFEAL